MLKIAASVAERIGLVLLPGASWIEAVLETALELTADDATLDVELLKDEAALLELDEAALLIALDAEDELAAALWVDDELLEAADCVALLAAPALPVV